MKVPFFFDYRYAAGKGNIVSVDKVTDEKTLVPGDHIFYTKVTFAKFGEYRIQPEFMSHHAVYVGLQDISGENVNAVVHLDNDNGITLPNLIPLNTFFKTANDRNADVFVIMYKDRLSLKDAVDRCMKVIENPSWEFNRFSKNCEMLATYCVLGDEQSASKQVEAFKRTGYAIGASALGAAGLALGAKALRAGAMQKSRKSNRSKRSKSKTKTTKRSKRTKTTKRSRKPRTKRSRRSRSRRS